MKTASPSPSPSPCSPPPPPSPPPSLQGDITVNAAIVTVGDMFDNAGALAETAIFRAPAPGTTGIVALADVQQRRRADRPHRLRQCRLHPRPRRPRLDPRRRAAARRPDRRPTSTRRGISADGITADDPLRCRRHQLQRRGSRRSGDASPTSATRRRTGTFTARFTIAGIDQPGRSHRHDRADDHGAAPHRRRSPAGTILTAADFELAAVPLATANAGGYADLDQLVGKQLRPPEPRRHHAASRPTSPSRPSSPATPRHRAAAAPAP